MKGIPHFQIFKLIRLLLKLTQTIIMNQIAARLEQAINEYLPKLKLLPEQVVSKKPSPNKWSKKEILGHLVDSAQNNLRRFIVAQYEDNPKIVYRQDDWVRTNNYQNAVFEDLINL